MARSRCVASRISSRSKAVDRTTRRHRKTATRSDEEQAAVDGSSVQAVRTPRRPQSVEDVGGVGVREIEFPVVVAEQKVDALARGFLEGEALTAIEGAFGKSKRLWYRREGGRGPFGPRPWRQPAKAPIWAVAAFFSIWASAGAS
jgi:hypothetical protein